MRWQIACGISGSPRQRRHGILRLSAKLEQRLYPTGRHRYRKHLIGRTVKQLARPEPRHTPQPRLDEVSFDNARDQFIAQLRLGLNRQQFQTGRGAPHFTQQAGIDTRALCSSGQQCWRKPLEHIGLLISIQPARHASPENPPLDLVLHLVGELQAAGVDPPSLFDAKVVARKAKPGAKTEATQIQPARFVRRAALAPLRQLQHAIGDFSDRRKRPRIAAQAQRLLELRGHLLRCERGVSERCRNQSLGRRQRFIADHCRWSRRRLSRGGLS